VVAVECLGKQIGRVRLKCIHTADGENLMGLIKENVEKGSTIITDGWQGYSQLADSKDYDPLKRPIAGSARTIPHMVDSLLKKWINGTHQGNIFPKYLGFYLDEYAFPFQQKAVDHRGKCSTGLSNSR
jgi:hypothetical protein